MDYRASQMRDDSSFGDRIDISAREQKALLTKKD